MTAGCKGYELLLLGVELDEFVLGRKYGPVSTTLFGSSNE